MSVQISDINRTSVYEFGECNVSLEQAVAVSGRHDFIKANSVVAVSTLLVLTLATVVGTGGNLLILIVVATKKKLQEVETAFIVNLAIADLYVTSVADPMSIVAKIEGEAFFEQFPGLCQTIASLCTISCVTSLMTIAVMSVNRYIYICTHEKYERIFSKWNCICISMSLYLVGGMLVLLNAASIGGHGFDRKSVECIWDRMATYPYTVVFSVVLVWIPSLVTGICYLKIYLYVRAHRRRVRAQQYMPNRNTPFLRNFRLSKTLFIIYAVFISCWAPYALLIVIDSEDTFPHELHVYITMFAHLHPSLNWFIYYVTNRKFTNAYKQLFNQCKMCSFSNNDIESTCVQNSAMIQNCASKHSSLDSRHVNGDIRNGGNVTLMYGEQTNTEKGCVNCRQNVTESVC